MKLNFDSKDGVFTVKAENKKKSPDSKCPRWTSQI